MKKIFEIKADKSETALNEWQWGRGTPAWSRPTFQAPLLSSTAPLYPSRPWAHLSWAVRIVFFGPHYPLLENERLSPSRLWGLFNSQNSQLPHIPRERVIFESLLIPHKLRKQRDSNCIFSVPPLLKVPISKLLNKTFSHYTYWPSWKAPNQIYKFHRQYTRDQGGLEKPTINLLSINTKIFSAFIC